MLDRMTNVETFEGSGPGSSIIRIGGPNETHVRRGERQGIQIEFKSTEV